MVDAGIARKVDFGEGRFRFEHSYRHPRHFHLICKTCHRSSEFLSSDIEVLVEEVATARSFTASQSVVQIYGTCEECRTGRAATGSDGTTDLVFARMRCGWRLPPSAAASSSTPERPALTRDTRARRCFEHLALEEKEHLGKLEARYAELLPQRPAARGAARPSSSSRGRPTASFLRRHRGLQGRRRPAGPAHRHQVRAGLAPFFKKYGERSRSRKASPSSSSSPTRSASTSSCSSANTARW